MRNIFIFVLICLFTIKLFACDCTPPKIAIELYESDFVFKGKVTQKFYSTDLSNYTITIEAIKFFKGGENAPKEFTYTMKSRHNLVQTSCDYFIDKFETLLLYVKFDGEKYSLDLMCSNSKRLNNNKKINKRELDILNNADKLDLSDYLLEQHYGFSFSKPITNADSILTSYNKKTVEKNKFSIVIIDIDQKGKIIRAYLQPKSSKFRYKNKNADTIFRLNCLIPKDYRKPIDEFEKVILKISRKLKYWTPYTHKKTGLTFRHRKHIIFHSDSKGNITIEY